MHKYEVNQSGGKKKIEIKTSPHSDTLGIRIRPKKETSSARTSFAGTARHAYIQTAGPPPRIGNFVIFSPARMADGRRESDLGKMELDFGIWGLHLPRCVVRVRAASVAPTARGLGSGERNWM